MSGHTAESRMYGWRMPIARISETVQVSSYGIGFTSCNVVYWDSTFPHDMTVNVECRDRLGALIDSRYTVLLIE